MHLKTISVKMYGTTLAKNKQEKKLAILSFERVSPPEVADESRIFRPRSKNNTVRADVAATHISPVENFSTPRQRTVGGSLEEYRQNTSDS